MSVPIFSRSNLEVAAAGIKGIISRPGNEVVCIKLVGEFFANLNDELNVSYGGSFAESHTPVTAPKQYYYAGSINYETDTPPGTNQIISIKSISNNANAPASQLAPVWDDCVGEFIKVAPCGGMGRRRLREHRRFYLDFLVGDTTEAKKESIELPVKSSASAKILACGQAAAALPGLYCMGYRGESYDRFDKTI